MFAMDRGMPSWVQRLTVQGRSMSLHIIPRFTLEILSPRVCRSRNSNMGLEQAGLSIWIRRSRLHISSLARPWARPLGRRPR